MTILKQEGPGRSDEAKSIARRILGEIPMEMLKYHEPAYPGGKPYLFRPLCSQVEFVTTAAEREIMRIEAERYNKLHQENELIAHGGVDVTALCQILLDKTLYHNTYTECYGNLAVGKGQSVQVGGYYDTGWGIFVATQSYIRNMPIKNVVFPRRVVSLEGLEGIVVPTQIAPILREEFPRYSCKIYGYQGFAARIRG